MSARATQALSSFDLDFAGDSVGSVSVDGRPAAWTWADEELAITPAQALHDHEKFVVHASTTRPTRLHRRRVTPSRSGGLRSTADPSLPASRTSGTTSTR